MGTKTWTTGRSGWLVGLLVSACTSSHPADARPATEDAPSTSTMGCEQGRSCAPCPPSSNLCERCELEGGRCVQTCGGEPVACPSPPADACGAEDAPCTSAGGDAQVCLPGTTLLRGSDDPEYAMSFPRRVVYVSPFWLDVDEVTVGRYRACVARGECTEPMLPEHAAYLRDSDAAMPVLGVTLAQATAFCAAAGGRLPTETEWERAAAGPNARPFPWGTEASCEHANWGNCVGHPTPVGSYPLGRSPEGVNDLIGNVWELTSDRIQPYLPNGDYTAFDPEPPCDPAHPAREGVDMFVSIRGSSFSSASPAELARHPALRRARSTLAMPMPEIGFRCARDGS